MGRDTVNKGNGMNLAGATATVGLIFGVAMMTAVASAQPATNPPAGGTAPAAAPAQPGAPEAAPGTEPAPPAIGPDGLPLPATEAPAGEAPAAAPAAAEGAHTEITPYKMFMEATIVVQAVMIMLILWSVVTWSILISKLTFFSGLNSKSNRVVQIFRSAGSVADAAKNAKSYRDNPMAKMLIAAADELGAKKGGASGRVQARMGIVQAEAGEMLSSGMGIFATVGSISAFVGLFGTVWGIMNSFIGIAQSQTTNLAVVAPGIAEALFATAIGLFAAIPAVIFYNMFARRIGAYSTRMENFASEILVKIARDE